MSIGSRYRHTLAVRRLTPTGGVDAYGQPLTAETEVATIRGLVQPRAAREVALASEGGAVIGTHVLFTDPLADLTTDCWFVLDGTRYDLVSIADAGGVGHHLEIGLRSVA